MPENSKFPAPIYSATVLTQVFRDAQRLFLPSMIEIDLAHTVMLCEQGILSPESAKACLNAIQSLNIQELEAAQYSGDVEDLFFLIEKKLASLCGEENAGRIHTARSRNDLDMTMYRMVLRGRLLQTLDAVNTLRARLLALAVEHAATLMPAYTHNQPAQPTTLGHYLMAAVEFLQRDAERLQAAFQRVNRSPLGACAITTTGFPIARLRTCSLLGFDGLQTNSYGAIATVDYIAESCSTLAVAMLSLGRLTQDLLLWSTVEFDYLRLSDGYVQISSIMPQKRNPVPLEHVRILSSRALTEANAALGSLHNTPFADMNDSEDSFQPLVAVCFNDGIRALTLLEGVLSEATFNTARMHERAGGNFLTVTELADTLARETGMPFQQSHGYVSRAVKALRGTYAPAEMVDHVTEALTQDNITPPSRETLLQSLDPQHFVDVRTIAGGPAYSALRPEFDHAALTLDANRAWCELQRNNLQRATAELQMAVKKLTA